MNLISSPAWALTVTTAAVPPGNTTASYRPDWAELTAAQRVALKPLAASWAGINEPQKRKWIALAQGYPNLSPTEQVKLHSRMHEWAELSAAQRSQARLNFAETKKLSADEKRTQWEAYQALSPAEKQKLVANAPTKPIGAAPALTPVPQHKLADVPPSRSDIKLPRFAKLKLPADSNALVPLDTTPLQPLPPLAPLSPLTPLTPAALHP